MFKNLPRKKKTDQPKGDCFDIQKKLVQQLAKDIKSSWQRIEVHFEHYNHENTGYSTKFSAQSFDNGQQKPFSLGLETLDLFIELQALMTKDQESWRWLELKVEENGKFDFDFKYDIPPYIKVKLEANGLLDT